MTLRGEEVGEVLANFKDGKLSFVTVSVANKGDDYEIITKTKFTEAVNKTKKLLGDASGVKEETRRKEEMITKAEGAVWRCKKGLFVGEWLFLPEKKEEVDGWIFTTKEHGEFVRMRLMPPSGLLGMQLSKAKASTSRQQLAAKVKREGTSSIIQGIPMVDQGSKGYCAVASFERVLRHYGADIDMHDLANLAETYGGTDPQKMKSAIYKVAQKLSLRTREPFFLKMKQYESMFDQYNKLAKKDQKTEINLETTRNPWDDVDPDLLKKSRTASQEYMKFKTEVVQNINKGIPILWALQLGLFWEDGIEDSYEANRYAVTKEDTPEDEKDAEEAKKEAEEERKEKEELRKIFYTDSWGPGHELKSMPLDQAWAATSAMFVLEPQ
jgi:hypothetical protein